MLDKDVNSAITMQTLFSSPNSISNHVEIQLSSEVKVLGIRIDLSQQVGSLLKYVKVNRDCSMTATTLSQPMIF